MPPHNTYRSVGIVQHDALTGGDPTLGTGEAHAQRPVASLDGGARPPGWAVGAALHQHPVEVGAVAPVVGG